MPHRLAAAWPQPTGATGMEKSHEYQQSCLSFGGHTGTNIMNNQIFALAAAFAEKNGAALFVNGNVIIIFGLIA